MTKLRIELSKEDIKRVVLEHLAEEFRLESNGRRGRAWDNTNITWTDTGGMILERDDNPPPKSAQGEFKLAPDWDKLVSDGDDTP